MYERHHPHSVLARQWKIERVGDGIVLFVRREIEFGTVGVVSSLSVIQVKCSTAILLNMLEITLYPLGVRSLVVYVCYWGAAVGHGRTAGVIN